MKTDKQLKQDVLTELVFQPHVDETEIGVIVENGVVTLTGIVDNFQKKVAADKTVKKILGVKAVVDEISVNYGTAYKKTDKEIAKAIVSAFEWNTAVPEEKIKIELNNGWVFLNGKVEFDYEKAAAKRVTDSIFGVKGVINNIEIERRVQPANVKVSINKAFDRLASIDAENIKLKVAGNTVTLSGNVNSIAEKEEANRIAYRAPGVYRVKNELIVKGIKRVNPI